MSAGNSLTIGVAQMNPIVGDLAGNSARIQLFYERAAAQGAQLVVFPELALTGYPPEDLVLMHSFTDRAMLALQELAGKTAQGPAMLLGTVWEEAGMVSNAAVMLEGGRVAHVQRKTLLPNYGVFDEKRLFNPGDGMHVLLWRGLKLGILVCEDVWNPGHGEQLAAQGCELSIVINASPFEADKLSHRKGVAAAMVNKSRAPLLYVNLVGGQDDLVFDGGSFALTSGGLLAAQLHSFGEALEIIELQKQGGRWEWVSAKESPALTHEESLWQAMALGLHDYVGKNGFKTVMLGLSGGIDSALTAALAVDALGADAVKGVLLPSPYTSAESIEDALESAKLLGIETMTVPITPAMGVMEESLSPTLGGRAWMDEVLVGGNLQSRLRGVTLMAISNKKGWMLLSTGNKSEIAVGYTTLYGDSCGGYNVLKDLYKTQVYQLAQWRNGHSPVVPERSITKAPSAELAPGQKDEDQLPPYELLDAILVRHLEERMSAEEIVADGYDPNIVTRVLKLIRMAEYKRRQSCPGVKLSPMLFGRDRRYPITNKF